MTVIRREITHCSKKADNPTASRRISVFVMVPILDGNSEHVAHALRKIGLFGENNPICDSF